MNEEDWFEAEEAPAVAHHVRYDCSTRKTEYRLVTEDEQAETDRLAEAFRAQREADAKAQADRLAATEAALQQLESSSDPHIQAIAALLRDRG